MELQAPLLLSHARSAIELVGKSSQLQMEYLPTKVSNNTLISKKYAEILFSENNMNEKQLTAFCRCSFMQICAWLRVLLNFLPVAGLRRHVE
jgi:hypothetical protein